MHETIRDWVHYKVKEFGLEKLNTLEVGSLNVNGTARWAFSGPYTGIDIEAGRCVDIVMDAHDLKFPDASFDVVLCNEMLEHDSAFWITLSEIGRVLKPGGHLLLTTRSNGFGEHNYPSDYWRFMPSSGQLIAELASCRLISSEPDPKDPGIFVHGVRRGEKMEKIAGWVDSYERLEEVMKSRGLSSVKLDIGSGGFSTDETFISVDLYTDADMQCSMSAIPLPDESVDAIWSSQALEHLPKKEVVPTLLEWIRLAKPEATIQFTVPDLEWNAWWWLRHQSVGWDMDIIYGHQTHAGEYHKTGFSMQIIVDYLQQVNWHLLQQDKDPIYIVQIKRLEYVGGEEYDISIDENGKILKKANSRSIAVDLRKVLYQDHIETLFGPDRVKEFEDAFVRKETANV